MDECFEEIVQKAREHVKSGQHESGHKLFFEINGMIGLAPEEAQEGDLICQFRNSDIIVIVRRDAVSYKIIGRAVEFLAEGGRPKPFRWRGEDPDHNGFDVPSRPIDFWMDIQTLQLLTKVDADGQAEPTSWALTAAHRARSW